MANVFHDVDLDGDGLVDVEEFCTAVVKMLPMASEEVAIYSIYECARMSSPARTPLCSC